MRIGIIGAGLLGSNLARKLAGAGHRVKLANSRGPETLADLASEIEAQAVAIHDATKDVDVVVISIPQSAIGNLPEDLFENTPDSVIVIDTGNYYPGLRDEKIADIEAGLAESTWASGMLERPVIKAFNSIGFPSLAGAGKPSGDPDRIALPIAGDSAEAKSVVASLMDDIGFDGVDAGPLESSWRQQPGTPAYCTDLDRENLVQALALADRARAPALRDEFVAEMKEAFQSGPAPDLVSLGRSIYGAPIA